jgi:hypothetical protein
MDVDAAGEPLDFRRLVWDHLAAVVSAVAVAALALRVTLISRGNVQTAEAILRYVGPGAILLGVLPLAVVFVHAVGLIELFLIAFARPGVSTGGRTAGRWGLLVFALLAVFVQPVLVLAPLAVVCGWLAFFHRRYPDAEPAIGVTTMPERVVLVVLVVLLVLASPVGWLPEETLILRHGDPVVGYVLRDGSEPLVVLRSSDSHVVFMEGVERRFICGERSFLSMPPRWLLTDADYPPCG